MHSRWFNITIVLLWLSSMCWLVTAKILPTLLVGEPPAYSRSLRAQEDEPPVGWTMWWDDCRLGRALTTTEASHDNLTDVCNRLYFEHVPLGDIIPPLLQNILSPAESIPDELSMNVVSHLSFDRKGRLTDFRSSLRLEGDIDAIDVQGTVEGGYLALSMGYAGVKTYETDMLLPRDIVLGDGLSPQPRLSGLREGQTWIAEVFSPLRPPNDPVEILHARVEGTEPLVWNDETIKTWLVVYRDDPDNGSGGQDNSRGRIWVRSDGVVLKQQVALFSATVSFVRMGDEEAAALAEDIAEELASSLGRASGTPTNDDEM